MTASGLTWVYAVVPDVADGILDGMTGVAGEPLRSLTAPGLALVVGSVPREDFNERALQQHLADLRWLEDAVRSHHRVIAELARTRRTLPLRFATLYRDDRGAVSFLRGAGERLQAALDRIADRDEWNVKAYPDAPAPNAPTADPADPPGGAVADDRPGSASLLRRGARRDDRVHRSEQAHERARQIHAALAALADEAAEHPLQSAEASGRAAPMLLNGAYLVEHARAAEFGAAVTELGRRLTGVRMELTGPWPPYSFVEIDAEPAEPAGPVAGSAPAEGG